MALRKVSAKARRRNRAVSKVRQAIKESLGCEVCLYGFPESSLDVHEIAAGRGRQAALGEPMLLMAVCRGCHDEIQGTKAATQIATKARWVIHETCKKYCEAMGLSYSAVTPEEVVRELVKMEW